MLSGIAAETSSIEAGQTGANDPQMDDERLVQGRDTDHGNFTGPSGIGHQSVGTQLPANPPQTQFLKADSRPSDGMAYNVGMPNTSQATLGAVPNYFRYFDKIQDWRLSWYSTARALCPGLRVPLTFERKSQYVERQVGLGQRDLKRLLQTYDNWVMDKQNFYWLTRDQETARMMVFWQDKVKTKPEEAEQV
jgi:hypothetical protein